MRRSEELVVDGVADREAEIGFLFGIGVDPLVAFLFNLDRGQEGAVLLFDPADIGDGIATVWLFLNISFQPEVERVHQDEGKVEMSNLLHILPFSSIMPSFEMELILYFF
jgi:hypothetical protein